MESWDRLRITNLAFAKLNFPGAQPFVGHFLALDATEDAMAKIKTAGSPAWRRAGSGVWVCSQMECWPYGLSVKTTSWRPPAALPQGWLDRWRCPEDAPLHSGAPPTAVSPVLHADEALLCALMEALSYSRTMAEISRCGAPCRRGEQPRFRSASWDGLFRPMSEQNHPADRIPVQKAITLEMVSRPAARVEERAGLFALRGRPGSLKNLLASRTGNAGCPGRL